GLARIVTYQRAAVLLRRGDRYRVSAERGYEGPHHSGLLEEIAAGGPVDRALRSEQPAVCDGESCLAIPMLARGEVIGVLVLEGSGYDEERTRIAVSFTQPAVIAVENARRVIDVVGRTGGEEFAVVLPGASHEAAVGLLAERIRHVVGDEPIVTEAGEVQVTISVGVASAHPGCEDLHSLLKAADAARYEAKRGGRNRVAS